VVQVEATPAFCLLPACKLDISAQPTFAQSQHRHPFLFRFTLEGLIEELERHFDSAHANYTATTEQRTLDFKNLTMKDQQSAKVCVVDYTRLLYQLSSKHHRTADPRLQEPHHEASPERKGVYCRLQKPTVQVVF